MEENNTGCVVIKKKEYEELCAIRDSKVLLIQMRNQYDHITITDSNNPHFTFNISNNIHNQVFRILKKVKDYYHTDLKEKEEEIKKLARTNYELNSKIEFLEKKYSKSMFKLYRFIKNYNK